MARHLSNKIKRQNCAAVYSFYSNLNNPLNNGNVVLFDAKVIYYDLNGNLLYVSQTTDQICIDLQKAYEISISNLQDPKLFSTFNTNFQIMSCANNVLTITGQGNKTKKSYKVQIII